MRLDEILRDFRYAARSLRKDRRLTLTAILALSLGIGACTVVFSVIYSVFFSAFPYKNFDRLTVVEVRNLGTAGNWKTRNYFSGEEARAFREQNQVFENTVAYMGNHVLYDDGETLRYLPIAANVTSNAFEFLGIPPLLGRTISEEDERPGAPPVFVLGYRLWKSEFRGDSAVVGKTFLLDSKPTTLVGVMPPRFDAFGASFWLPVVANQARIMGRLKPGVSIQTAQANLDAIAHQVQKANPAATDLEQFAIVAQPLLDSKIGSFRTTLYALLAAVFLLLLIACSNVANLLLARATAREREIALRATLGASRARLIRQLLAESSLIAFAGTVLGSGLSVFGLQAVVALIPPGTLPSETSIQMYAPVLVLSLGIAALTTILCGLAPALHIARGDLQLRLSGTRQGGGNLRRGNIRSTLVVCEVALSIVLLIVAGLLMRSFFALTRVDFGFPPERVAFLSLALPHTYNFSWADPHTIQTSLDKKNTLTRRLLDRISTLPGVTSAAELMDEPPPLKSEWSDTIIPGKPHSERWETHEESCSEGYFATLGLPLLRGRLFDKGDVTSARFVMDVNETFARLYFPGENPLGKRVRLGVFDLPFLAAPRNVYFEIIGVVGNRQTRTEDSSSWQVFPEVFYPYSVQSFNWRAFMARTNGDPKALLKTMGQEVRAIDPAVVISESGSLDSFLREFYRGPKFELVVLASFASIGLLLVLIGIFSVMAYTVSLRTYEIGVRAALGAQRSNIFLLMLRRGFRWILSGIVLGVMASYALTRFLASQISGVSPTDPLTFTTVSLLVALVGMAACFLPARRAASVDPLVALRHE